MNRITAIVLAVLAAGIVATTGSAGSAARSGALHVTKECSHYDGTVGSFCTMRLRRSSSLAPKMPAASGSTSSWVRSAASSAASASVRNSWPA